MTDATQTDDTIAPQTPVAGGEQGGAFGGQPYDPNASTSSDGDFVLDMDDIPDFSLDDLGEDIEEETPTPSVDQPAQDEPVSTSPAPDVAPATPEISLDLDNLGDSIKEPTEQVADSVDVATPASEESSPAVEPASVGDFDLDLGSLEEPTVTSDTPTTPDVDVAVGAVENSLAPESVENTEEVSFDLGNIAEPVQETVENTVETVVESTAPAADFDLNLDSVEEEVAPVEPATDPSPTPETEAPAPVADDFDLGDIAPAVEETPKVENVSVESAPVSDAASVVAPVVATVARVDVPEDVSPLGTKVVSLMNRTLEAQSLLDEPVRVLGASHDREQVHYEFSMDDDQVLTVVRDAVDGDNTVTKTNLTLSFVGSSLVVRLDDVVVFDEAHDDDIYQKYAHTISEKMGKFGMHIDDYIAGAQDKAAAKAATQKIKQAGKQLQAF